MFLRFVKRVLAWSLSAHPVPIQIVAIDLQDRIITARDGLQFTFEEDSLSLRTSYLLVLTENPPRYPEKMPETLRQILGITPEMIAAGQAQITNGQHNKKATKI